MQLAPLLLLAAVVPLAAQNVPVVIETEAGSIEIEVDMLRAPVTAQNFLRYVDFKLYDGGAFHRTVKTRPDNQPQNEVKINVIQARAKTMDKPPKGFRPIPLERTKDTGLTHLDGTVSMARTEPDSAMSDFFVCIGAQPSLDFGGQRNPDGQGFAAFGRVTKGMDVVRDIQQSPAEGQQLKPPVKIMRAYRR
jgi:peptidyl-prolyl cis-trans isomerase A (cyclophilin A)